MNYQQMTFLDVLDENQQQSFRGGSRASLTALLESVWRLLTSVSYGQKCGELLAKLSPNGYFAKTYEGCFQVKMDGSFEELSGILPNWGMLSDGELRALPQLEPYIDESGWRLLPTPTRIDSKGGCRRKNSIFQKKCLQNFMYTYSDMQTKTTYLNPAFLEALMGFPEGWTELAP